MKKYFLTGLVFMLLVSLGYGKTFKTSTNVNYDVSVTNEGYLKVSAWLDGVEFKRSEFEEQREGINDYKYNLQGGLVFGDYILKVKENGFATFDKEYNMLFQSTFSINEKDGKIQEEKLVFDKEYYYGFGGVSKTFPLKRENYKVFQYSEYGDHAHQYIPFFFSSGGDAFYYNAKPKDQAKFSIRPTDGKANLKSKSGQLEFYYYYEKDMKKLVQKFYKFSDSYSLLPKWAYGYIQSKYGYENEEEVYNLVENFEKYDLPVSAIILDLQWFNKMGDLYWNKENWPNHMQMDKMLEQKDIKLITISEPFFTNDSLNYNKFKENGLFAVEKNGNPGIWNSWWCFGADYGSIMNPIAPKAKEYIGNLYMKMKESGIDGFWTDLGEPESTPDNVFFNEYTEEEFHNYYNREWSKLIYEVMEENYPDERPLILSRSGFTGSAKYNVSIWSGDVGSSFKALNEQIEIGLNAGVTGFSYWGSDVGGFESGQRKPKEELFIRWMQFGLFSPVFRPHGAMSPREPWMYENEDTTEMLTMIVKERDNLLPYIYSSAYQTYLEGIPMMRPLFMEHNNDKSLYKLQNQYYFGDNIMVAPIVDSMRRKQEKKVYLPEGKWYDYFTMDEYSGGEIIIPSVIEELPVYIKEGGIVPKKDGIIMIPGEETSTYTLYDDDGVSNDYKKGVYEKIEFILNDKGCEITSNVEKDIVIKVLKKKVKLEYSEADQEDENFYIFKTRIEKGVNQFFF